jgi:outer membrane protein
LMKLEADWKDLRYRREDYALGYDGPSSSVALSYFRNVSARWMLFGGVDFVKSETPFDVSSYRQKGVRLGASLQWPQGFSGTVFAAYRRRDYAAYSPLLAGQRRDDEQNYALTFSAARWKTLGMTPSVSFRHNRVDSSIDWLYTYDKNTIGLELERQF